MNQELHDDLVLQPAAQLYNRPDGEGLALGVSIIIPAYNEEAGIKPVLTQLQTVLAASNLRYEVIVVDDGSVDGTATVVQEHAGVILLQHKGNRGYGAALKTGIRRARYELICITDADGTYPNHYIPELAGQIISENYDMVVGARTGKNVSIPLIRRGPKWFIRRLASFVAGEPIPDLNSGLRIFRRETVMRFFYILPNGFSFTTTITLGMLTNGYLVDYTPIDYRARIGRSKIRPIHDTLNFIQLVMRIALYFAPLKIFLPLSLLFIGIATVWALFSRFVLGQLADVSTLVIAMTGIQVGVIGMLAELINGRLPNLYREEDKPE